MKIEPISKICSGQDGAIFRDFLFRFDGAGVCHVYRMTDILAGEDPAKDRTPIDIFTLDQTERLCPHSNSVMFGCAYGSPTDEFPVLYTNIYTTYQKEANKRKGMCAVYRITRNGTRFSSELIQVLRIGFTEDPMLWHSSEARKDVRPYGNFALDPGKEILYAFTMRDESHTTRYFAFRVPKLTDGVISADYGVREVVLEPSDILMKFDCPYHHFLQGACFHDGKIYSVEGFCNDPVNPPAVRILDPAQKRQIFYGDFTKLGYFDEAELIDFHGDTCYYSDIAGNFFRLTFSE